MTNTIKPYKRKYVDAKDDLSIKEVFEKYISLLEKTKITNHEELLSFIEKKEDILSVVNDASSRAYVNMTVNTQDKEAEKKYLYIVENILPMMEKASHMCSQKIISAPALNDLDPYYDLYIKEIKTDMELYMEENLELFVEDDKLKQQHQKISGSWMVTFQGEEMTLQKAYKFLQEPDRGLREKAWRAVREVKEKDSESLNEIYSKMISVRHKIAQNAGCSNYAQYLFRDLKRYDYTPEDCRNFHELILKYFVPICNEYDNDHIKKLGLSSGRPWDFQVDSLGRPPLRPFSNVSELINGCSSIFKKCDSDLSIYFDYMANNNMLDLESRKGKAPGGYQIVFDETREPFIFMNAVGTRRDVDVLLHESGHSFHTFLSREHSLVNYRYIGHEFCEVASMSMELLCRKFIEEFYKKDEDLKRVCEDQLAGIIELMPFAAMVDSFQLWVYENPTHNHSERYKKWTELEEKYRPTIDWSGFERAKESGWQFMHIFESPLYYIEYGIAQLGALQVWENSKKDYSAALKMYKDALKLGGSKSLPELFKTAGAQFHWDDSLFKKISGAVHKELKELRYDSN